MCIYSMKRRRCSKGYEKERDLEKGGKFRALSHTRCTCSLHRRLQPPSPMQSRFGHPLQRSQKRPRQSRLESVDAGLSCLYRTISASTSSGVVAYTRTHSPRAIAIAAAEFRGVKREDLPTKMNISVRQLNHVRNTLAHAYAISKFLSVKFAFIFIINLLAFCNDKCARFGGTIAQQT